MLYEECIEKDNNVAWYLIFSPLRGKTLNHIGIYVFRCYSVLRPNIIN